MTTRYQQPMRRTDMIAKSSSLLLLSLLVLLSTTTAATTATTARTSIPIARTSFRRRRSLHDVNINTALLLLRGGGIGDSSSGGDLNDEELDEYIEFLLAAAEDKVSEAENPLFLKKKQEEVVVEDDDEQSTFTATASVPVPNILLSDSSSNVLADAINENQNDESTEAAAFIAQPDEQSLETDEDEQPTLLLVDDVEDVAQLDDMIETLVATVSDDDEEEEDEAPLAFEEAAVQEEEENASSSGLRDDDDILVDDKDEEEEILLSPLVDDVEDEAQLDEMIETLVATVEGDEQEQMEEEEEEEPVVEVEIEAETLLLPEDTPQVQAAEQEEETTTASESEEMGAPEQFFLGPSAVEDPPLASSTTSSSNSTDEAIAAADSSTIVEDIESQLVDEPPTSHTMALMSSLLQRMKEKVGYSYEDSAGQPQQQEEEKEEELGSPQELHQLQQQQLLDAATATSVTASNSFLDEVEESPFFYDEETTEVSEDEDALAQYEPPVMPMPAITTTTSSSTDEHDTVEEEPLSSYLDHDDDDDDGPLLEPDERQLLDEATATSRTASNSFLRKVQESPFIYGQEEESEDELALYEPAITATTMDYTYITKIPAVRVVASEQEDDAATKEEEFLNAFSMQSDDESQAETPEESVSTKLKQYYSDSVWAMRDKYKRAWGTAAGFMVKKREPPLSSAVATADNNAEKIDADASMAATAATTEETTRPARDFSRIYEKYYHEEKAAEPSDVQGSISEIEDEHNVDQHPPETQVKETMFAASKEKALRAWGTLRDYVVKKEGTKPMAFVSDSAILDEPSGEPNTENAQEEEESNIEVGSFEIDEQESSAIETDTEETATAIAIEEGTEEALEVFPLFSDSEEGMSIEESSVAEDEIKEGMSDFQDIAEKALDDETAVDDKMVRNADVLEEEEVIDASADDETYESESNEVDTPMVEEDAFAIEDGVTPIEAEIQADEDATAIDDVMTLDVEEHSEEYETEEYDTEDLVQDIVDEVSPMETELLEDQFSESSAEGEEQDEEEDGLAAEEMLALDAEEVEESDAEETASIIVHSSNTEEVEELEAEDVAEENTTVLEAEAKDTIQADAKESSKEELEDEEDEDEAEETVAVAQGEILEGVDDFDTVKDIVEESVASDKEKAKEKTVESIEVSASIEGEEYSEFDEEESSEDDVSIVSFEEMVDEEVEKTGPEEQTAAPAEQETVDASEEDEVGIVKDDEQELEEESVFASADEYDTIDIEQSSDEEEIEISEAEETLEDVVNAAGWHDEADEDYDDDATQLDEGVADVEDLTYHEEETDFLHDSADVDDVTEGDMVLTDDETESEPETDVAGSLASPSTQPAIETGPINFFYRFLLARGLEPWVMICIVIVEWFRIYLSPIAELPGLILNKESREIRIDQLSSTFIRTRGGAATPQSEVSDDTDEEEDSLDPRIAEEGPGPEGVDISESHDHDKMRSKKKRSKKRRDVAVETYTPIIEDEVKTMSTATEPLSAAEPNSHATKFERPLLVPSVRPNPIYRYLLGYGRVGHILIMEFTLAIGWIQTYVPALAALLNWIAAQIFPSRRTLMDEADAAVSQTTGFVSADGSAVRGGRKKKGLTKKEDQKALSQLQEIGDVTQAKYRFLSESFMMRHTLGPYASQGATEKMIEYTTKPSRKASKKKNAAFEPDVEESDAEWIVEALTQEETMLQKGPIDSSVSVSMGSDGPAVSVGVEFSFGESRKKRKRSTISEVARQSSTAMKKKNTGPRLSDREGGVMGRIRAAGANSLMGRNLMGAYPGDAPPPNEAASSSGLLELAQKYGYGDWSDYGNQEDEGDEPKRRRRRKTRTNVKPSRVDDLRRRKRDSSAQIGLEFDLGSKSSSELPRVATARTLLSRDRDNTVLGSAMDKLDEIDTERKSSSELPRVATARTLPPQERDNTVLGSAMDKLGEIDTEKKISRRRKVRRKNSEDKLVKPVMEILRDAKSAQSSEKEGKVIKSARDVLREAQKKKEDNSSD